MDTNFLIILGQIFVAYFDEKIAVATFWAALGIIWAKV